MFKFMHGGWVTVLLAGCIIIVMLVWFNARKIKNRHMQFVKIQPFFSTISDLKEDETIPKYATNLVYISKANYNSDIENKIVYSIINKQPKRADYYWILHIDLMDDPNTFEYTFDQLVPGVLFRVNLRIGFKIQPMINLYFRQIVDELVANNEFDLRSNYPSLRKHDITADFKFILIHRIFSLNQITNFNEKLSLSIYNIVKTIGISDLKAYNLETSNVLVESVPLIVDTSCKLKIKRADK
jgi:KUP system potassium uptake protein